MGFKMASTLLNVSGGRMKRFLLGLLMVGGLAMLAAPMAYAANAPATICGSATADHNYAFLVTGTEPVTATSAAETLPLNYIAGIGVLKFGPYVAATETCSIISGEMIYLDNDYLTFQGGPEDCGPSGLDDFNAAEGAPCFNGTDTLLGGGVGPGPNGSATVEFVMNFPFVLGVGDSADIPLPFSFTLFATGGGATLEGNSNIPEGGTGTGDTSSNPPGSCEAPYDPVTGCGPNAPSAPLGPVLAFIGQRQATSAALNPVPTVAGAAPFIGNSATLCTGFGGNSGDGVAAGQATQSDEATGTYGATSGSLTEFANGYAFGSLTFNSNDDVGNTLGIANYDCDFQEQSFNRYGDGTTNNQAALYDENWPFAITPICRDADGNTVTATGTGVGGCTGPGTSVAGPEACCTGLGTSNGTGTCLDGGPVGADEVNSSVVWGTTDQNTYTIVTGVASPALGIPGNPYLPPGETASCTGLQEVATPGSLVVKAVPPSETDAGPYPQTKSIVLTADNTSEGACTVGGALVPVSAPAAKCSMSLSTSGVVSEGDGPQSSAWTANCTCTEPATNATCTGSGTPYACCTGSRAGTCAAETDTYDLYIAEQTNPPGVGGCPSTTQASSAPILLTCKN
jgi:hypothetical protein